jgi:hypothetical protein
VVTRALDCARRRNRRLHPRPGAGPLGRALIARGQLR